MDTKLSILAHALPRTVREFIHFLKILVDTILAI
jgi:hypothetical protein